MSRDFCSRAAGRWTWDGKIATFSRASMTDPDRRAVLRAFFQSLRDRPLDLLNEADRKLYEPLHDDDHDPVKRLFDTIEYSETESVQLVAGFRGTGKTTEFSRLERDLWEAGYLVIRVNLDEYVDMHSPVDIRDFLLIVAGAISDTLTSDKLLGPKEGVQTNFWERVHSLLNTSVQAKEATVKTPVADLKLALQADATFREKVRSAFSGRIEQLVSEVHKHHQKVLEALRLRHGPHARLVVILDSLEHLRGTFDRAEMVRKSVEELFFTHGERIGLPETHIIISVPAFLAVKADNLAAQFMNGKVEAWPAYRVRDKSGQPTAVVDRITALVRKRGDWQKILPNSGALEQVILASGGHLRDLFNMLIEAIHLAGKEIRVDAADKVVSYTRRAYMPLFKDELEVLRHVATTQGFFGIEGQQREYVYRFLDAGLLLCYLNDEFWYDVHPLVKDVVLAS